MRKYLSSLCFFIICLTPVFSESLDKIFEELSSDIENAESLANKEEALIKRAQLYEISGKLELAKEDYILLVQIHPDDWQYKWNLLQIKMETGEKNLLDELSRELINSPNNQKSSWVVLQVRYLISISQWDEAEALINQYRYIGEQDPVYAYLAWYVFSTGKQMDQSDFWAKILQDRFSHSPETMLMLGLATDSPSPEKLLLSRDMIPASILYYYQVGAYRRMEGARELIEQLAAMGMDSQLIQQGDWFKVLIPSTAAQNDELENILMDLGYKPFRVDL